MESTEQKNENSSILVICPECKGSFYLQSIELGILRPCPFCGKTVTFDKVEVNQKKDEVESTKSSRKEVA